MEPVTGPAGRLWTFGHCRLDERALDLRVSGIPVAVDRKPMQVLLHLLRHAGEVVTKDELAEAVWTGRIITDATLTKTVAILRAALRDEEQTLIRTVYGYGYRLVAPVSVEARGVDAPEGPRLYERGPVPLRPGWMLERLLSHGGHGQVWLAHGGDSGARRVFKFATPAALGALKREVTLNRLLVETLPKRRDFLRLVEWNLDQPPFFIASEWMPRGSVAAWADSQGGLAALTLARRLEIMAQVAEAVAAAHSVGVLHKDLKPGNVLVEEAAGDAVPGIRLCDFASGGVLDMARLEACGITAHNFTAPLAESRTSSTPIYLAPEVFAGEPCTVRSDIYALGVMLYQFVVGDLRRPLAPGWESDVADELLRQDIAEAVAGKPQLRIADAGQLAQRLRSLEVRRRELGEQRQQAALRQRAERLRYSLRRWRLATAAVVAVGSVMAGSAFIAARARDEARAATRSTAAAMAFLDEALLAAADPSRSPVGDFSARDLLDRAAATVDERLAGQPGAAAQVHRTLGRAYRGMGELELARVHLTQAATLAAGHYGPASAQRFEALAPLSGVLMQLGRAADGCALVGEMHSSFGGRLSTDDDRGARLRLLRASCLMNTARNDEALVEYRAVTSELEQRSATRTELYRGALGGTASVLFNLGRFEEALGAARRSLATTAALHGEQHLETARRRAFLALCLIATGSLDEAERELLRALADEKRWSGDPSADIGAHTVLVAFLRIEQGRSAEAETAAREFLDSPLGQQIGSGYRPAAMTVLSEALLLQGRLDAAIAMAQQAISATHALSMPAEAHELHARAYWADALQRAGRLAEAAQVLDAITPAAEARVPAGNVALAQYRRSRALVWLAQGRREEARAALADSLQRYRSSYGDNHWRTRRAREELARIKV